MTRSVKNNELKEALKVAEGADLDSFLDSVLEKGLRTVGATQGSLMLLNVREGVLEIVERRGPPYDPKRKYRRFKVGEGIAGWVAQHCKPHLSPEVTQDPLFKRPLGEVNFHSLLAVPIARNGQAIGVICADDREPSKFSESDARTLGRLAEGIADTIEQLAVDTFISYKKRLKQLEALHEVGQELSRVAFESPEELPTLLEKIVKEAERVLEADLVTLYQYHEKDDGFEAPPTMSGDFEHPEWMVARVNRGDAPYRIVEMGKSYYSERARSDEIMRAREIVPAGDDLPERPSFVDREGIKSSAGILLRAGREVVGVMFINYRIPHPFPDEEKHVIEIFAAYTALAIQGARRFREAITARHLEALRLTSRIVAHRLRNILPVIDDRVERTLARRKVTGEGIEWCRVALNETVRAQNIVRDFETFARSEVFERPDELSGTELVWRLGEIAKQNLTQAGAQVEVRVNSDLPSVKVNLDRLSDDFANFVRDSERHKPSGLCITISGELASEADIQRVGLQSGVTYLKLIYIDNGPGIQSGLKQRVFEPFYTTTGGSGLGLAIARDNANVHEGTLIECGQPGNGVRFELYLPAARVMQKEELTG